MEKAFWMEVPCIQQVSFLLNFLSKEHYKSIFYSFAMLDQPGEFACVNLDGGQAEFRYIPVNDADASNENPILSNLEVIWNINRATNINVKGIKFEHSSSGGKDGYNWGPQSAVRILNTHDITFDNCQFSHIGKSSFKSLRT